MCYSKYTYSCLSNPALPELVEVNEELLDPDPVLGNQCLQSLLHVELDVHIGSLTLLCRRVEAVND